MSQVRKLLNGNKVPIAQQGYKFKLDSQEYDVTDEQLKDIDDDLRNLDPNLRRFLTNWTNGMKSGQGFVDSKGNMAWEGMLSGITKESDWKRLRSAKPDLLESIVGTDSYWAKQAVNAAINATYNVLNKPKASTSTSKTKLGSDELKLDFNTDSEGKSYLSPYNYSVQNRFNNILDYLENGENSTYSAPDDWDLADISAWINDQGGYSSANTYLKDLLSDLRKNGLKGNPNYKEQDIIDLFNMFRIKPDYSGSGYGSEDGESSDSDANIERKLKAAFTNPNNANLYKQLGNNIYQDSFGNWRLSDDFIKSLPVGNIYFSDAFYDVFPDFDLDSLKGLTLYNGVLYNLDDERLAKILNKPGGYNELVRNGQWDKAEEEIWTRFTPSQLENPVALNSDEYSTFIKPGMLISNLTGLREVKDQQPDQQLIQYVDLNNASNEGPYTKYDYKFALLDNKGNLIRDNIDKSEIYQITGGQKQTFNTYKKVGVPNAGAYANKYYEDIVDENNEKTGIRIYRDINNPNEDVILHIEGLKGSANGKDIKLPSEIAGILMQDIELAKKDPNKTSWVEKIVGNTQARIDFENALESLGQSNFSRLFDEWMNPATPFTFGTIDVDYKHNKLSRFIDESLINSLQTALEKASQGHRSDRRKKYYISPLGLKNGGKMQYIAKLADGGFAGGSTETRGVSESKVNGNVHNPNNAASLSDIGTDNWSENDTMDLLALFGDVASLGLAFVPGANIASTATGVASSLARFNADRGRNTKGAGWQLGLNLAMDAATLLPFLGGAAKTGKIVKAGKTVGKELLEKAARNIIKGASFYGAGSALITSAKKILNGEKFTVRDVSNVVNGITAGVGVAQSGGFGRSGKKVTELVGDEPVIKVKTGENGAKPEGAVENVKIKLSKLNDIDTPESFKKAVVSAAHNAGDSKVTLENVTERYDLSDFVTNNGKSWSPKWNPKTWFKANKKGLEKLNDKSLKVKTKSGTKPFTKEEIAKMSAFERWHRSLGNKQEVYWANRTNNRAIQNEVPGRIKSRIDVAEANGTTPGAKYYTDEFGTSYRVGKSKVSEAKLAQIRRARRLPERRAINDRNGFTGRVKVFEGATNPVSHTWYYPEIGIANPNIIIPLKLSGNEYSELPGTTKESYKKGGVLKAQTGSSSFTGQGVGGMEYDLPNSIKNLNPLVSLGRFTLKSKFQNRYLDQAKEMVNAARFNELAPVLNTYRTDNPALDRQSRQINSERMLGIKPVTSDVVANNAIQNQREGQLYDRERDIINQRSQFDWNAQRENTGIENQNIINAIQTANSNRARTASINSALKQQDMEHTLRRDQSWENLGLEIQTNLKKDRDVMLDYDKNVYASGLQKDYDQWLDSKFGAEARNKYNGLSYDEAMKYVDFEDYLKQNYSDLYRTNLNGMLTKQEDMKNKMRNWMYLNALNYNYPNILLGKTSPVGIPLFKYATSYKKGGKVNGTTRYKLEPDEQIWVDNNKATHAAVAKLSEATIKLLLRALK